MPKSEQNCHSNQFECPKSEHVFTKHEKVRISAFRFKALHVKRMLINLSPPLKTTLIPPPPFEKSKKHLSIF